MARFAGQGMTARPIHALVALLAAGVAAQASASGPGALFDWLPDTCNGTGVTLRVSRDYTPSGSTCDKGLDERSVFHASLSCREGNWRLGVGRGGQIYSLRGPFGESVPPQIHKGSAWNDEVWQLVAVATRFQGRNPLAPGRLPGTGERVPRGRG